MYACYSREREASRPTYILRDSEMTVVDVIDSIKRHHLSSSAVIVL